MDDDIIIITDLVKKFGDKTALDGLDLRVHRGELFGFLGPNGAGKTTTVRCIATLTNYDSGTIIVDGVDLKKNQTAAKNRMGVIQQQISLDKDLTIRENMISHAMYHLIPKKERDERIKELSDYFDLGEYLDKPVDSLSGGWKKRAAIVCAMLHEPAVLFLDEMDAIAKLRDDRIGHQRQASPVGCGQIAACQGNHCFPHHPLHRGGGGPMRQGRDHQQGENHSLGRTQETL